MIQSNTAFQKTSMTIIWFWLVVFALLPIILVFLTSLLTADPNHLVRLVFTAQNYTRLLNRGYIHVFFQSLDLAGTATLLCLIIAYPFAYIIAKLKTPHKPLLFLLIIIPFWISSLIRTYAIMAILKTKGLLNSLLISLGIIHHPLHLLYSYTAVLIGTVYDLLPFMILPLYTNIEKLDEQLIEAAKGLGANRLTVFRKIILPLTLPGILSGILLVFLPAMTLFYIPVLLGGAKNILVGNLIQNQFLINNDWPQGSAISMALILVLSLMIIYYWKHTRQKDRQTLI